MKYIKQLTLMLLSVILVFGVSIFLSGRNNEISLVSMISAAEIAGSGFCGTDAAYTLDGILTISENGADCSVHKWDGGVITTFATCKVNGVRTYTCENNPAHTYTENLGLNANNHVNTMRVPAIEATCSSVGYTAGIYCDDCGQYIAGHREIAKDTSAHKWDNGVITTPAACKTSGVKTYTCQHDSSHTYTEKTGVDSANHVNTTRTAEVEATCSEIGYTAGVYCNDCRRYVSGHKEVGINADNHKWNGGVITTFATCKVNGVRTYTCEHNPAHTYTESLGLDVNNHTDTRIVQVVAPTCSDVGYTAGRYCDDCGMYISGHREIAKDSSAHKWDSGVITTPAACKTGGVKTYTCQYDSQHTYNEKTAFNTSNHINTVNATAEEATCSENGYTAGVYCNDCKKYVSGHEKTGINADNHKWDGGVVTTFATCKVNGVKTYTCENNSGHTYTENLGLNVNNHKNTRIVPTVAPTCSEVGYTEGVYCNDCGQYVAGHREIAKDISAHNWDDGVITTPAACKTGGVKTYTCQHDFSHTYTEKTGFNGANHVNTVGTAEIEATCSEIGYTAGVYCNDCKKYVSGHEETGINAGNHKWDGGEITTFATCKINGVKTYTCENNSGHTYTEKLGLNADNHVNTVSASAVEATCSEVGYTAGIYCDDCHKYISGHKETEKNPSVHNNTTIVDEIPATTENAGYTAGVYCSDCQRYISGHTEIPKIEATFTDSENAVKAGKYIFVNCGLPVADLLSQAGKNAVIKDRSGSAVSADKLPGTGMTLMFSDGKQYTVIVLGDVDCDGAVTAADARLVLRAAVGLEQYKENSYQYAAGNVEAQNKLSAADARRILRTAVGLEKLCVTKKDS